MPSAGIATSVTQNAKDESTEGATLRNLHAVKTSKYYALTNPHSTSMKVAHSLLLSAAGRPDTDVGRIDADMDRLAAMYVIFGLRNQNCDMADGSATVEFREGSAKDYNDLYKDRLHVDQKASARSWSDFKPAGYEAIVMIDRSRATKKAPLIKHLSIVLVDRSIMVLMGNDFKSALSFIDAASRGGNQPVHTEKTTGPAVTRARKAVTDAFGQDFRGDVRPDLVVSRTNEPRKLVRAISIISQISVKTKSEARSRLAGLEPVDCAGLIGAQNGDSLTTYRRPGVLRVETSVLFRGDSERF